MADSAMALPASVTVGIGPHIGLRPAQPSWSLDAPLCCARDGLISPMGLQRAKCDECSQLQRGLREQAGYIYIYIIHVYI